MLAPRDTFETDMLASRPALRSFAIALCKNTHDADDMVQETFERALKHRDKFAPGTNLQAWLFVILRNLRYSNVRNRRREVEDPDDALAKGVLTEDDPQRRLEAQELLRLIDAMPAQWKRPLLLLADGASYEEIAAEIGERIGTVKSRVNRAREMLGGGRA